MNTQYGYLLPTDIHTTMQHIMGNVDSCVLKDANVLCAFSDGNYALCLLTPPERMCKVFINTRGDVVQADVIDVFNLVQEEGVSWCMI